MTSQRTKERTNFPHSEFEKKYIFHLKNFKKFFLAKIKRLAKNDIPKKQEHFYLSIKVKPTSNLQKKLRTLKFPSMEFCRVR